jgi:DNA (cytosine-5)-methyltransferase 1
VVNEIDDPLTGGLGTEKPWYKGWALSDAERARFRERSKRSKEAKDRAVRGEGPPPLHPVYQPRLDPERLMPRKRTNGLRTLSLFSGGGGLDLGFERAGFVHVASFELLADAAATLRANRPKWTVYGGADGDVRKVSWSSFRGLVDVIHGGPPCQPFSSAGRQQGARDARDMFPEFVRAVREIGPLGFIAENVPALRSAKFEAYVAETILKPLGRDYRIDVFEVAAEIVGVPQVRRRVIFAGVRKSRGTRCFAPTPTHARRDETPLVQGSLFASGVLGLPICPGVRYALGLPDIGVDGLAPTIRSGLTGPRHTTSVLSSVAAQRTWERLKIWPNGVAATREKASQFVAENGHFRLSIPDCALLQGFPASWEFVGAVYMALGQIGNAVAPPVGYAVARALADALRA